MPSELHQSDRVVRACLQHPLHSGPSPPKRQLSRRGADRRNATTQIRRITVEAAPSVASLQAALQSSVLAEATRHVAQFVSNPQHTEWERMAWTRPLHESTLRQASDTPVDTEGGQLIPPHRLAECKRWLRWAMRARYGGDSVTAALGGGEGTHGSGAGTAAAEVSTGGMCSLGMPNAAWTSRYSPQQPRDVCGNREVVNEMRKWLAAWQQASLLSGQAGSSVGSRSTGRGGSKKGRRKQTSKQKAAKRRRSRLKWASVTGDSSDKEQTGAGCADEGHGGGHAGWLSAGDAGTGSGCSGSEEYEDDFLAERGNTLMLVGPVRYLGIFILCMFVGALATQHHVDCSPPLARMCLHRMGWARQQPSMPVHALKGLR